MQPGYTRQVGDDVLRESIAEILLIRASALIGKRDDCDSGSIRPRDLCAAY